MVAVRCEPWSETHGDGHCEATMEEQPWVGMHAAVTACAMAAAATRGWRQASRLVCIDTAARPDVQCGGPASSTSTARRGATTTGRTVATSGDAHAATVRWGDDRDVVTSRTRRWIAGGWWMVMGKLQVR